MPNDNTINIPLTKGKVAIVDANDYQRVSAFKWHARVVRNKSNEWWYAKRTEWCAGKNITILLHRFIVNAPPNRMVDHENGNGLDCRRKNLRLATSQQNRANRLKPTRNPTGYKGVNLSPSGAYRARITFNNKNVHIGRFETAIEAARAYDVKAEELFGEFARLNFPK